MIIGHSKNVCFLENALKSGCLSHAFCFTGPEQVGKRTVAEHLASLVLNVEPEKLFSHGDYHYVKREVDEKKDKLKKDISIAQAKLINAFLANRSWFGGRKVVVIDEAETLNIEASNALLKSLEESVEDSLIILLTVDDRLLPITIRSRCQMVHFSLLSPEEMAEGLGPLGFAKEKIPQAIECSWGRPGRAIDLLSDEEKFINEINEINRIKSLAGAPFYKKLAAIEDVFGDKEDAIRGRDRIRLIINTWTMVWRDYLRGGSLDSNFDRRQAITVIDEFGRIQELIKQNVHPRLLIEKIILKI